MPRQRKTPADLLADVRLFRKSAHPEHVEGRAPNQRHFNILSDYAWELFRPPPSMLPPFPPCWTPKVERDEG